MTHVIFEGEHGKGKILQAGRTFTLDVAAKRGLESIREELQVRLRQDFIEAFEPGKWYVVKVREIEFEPDLIAEQCTSFILKAVLIPVERTDNKSQTQAITQEAYDKDREGNEFGRPE